MSTLGRRPVMWGREWERGRGDKYVRQVYFWHLRIASLGLFEADGHGHSVIGAYLASIKINTII